MFEKRRGEGDGDGEEGRGEESCVSLGRYNSLRSHQSCGVFMSDGLFGWIRFLEKHLRDGLLAEPSCAAGPLGPGSPTISSTEPTLMLVSCRDFT